MSDIHHFYNQGLADRSGRAGLTSRTTNAEYTPLKEWLFLTRQA